MVDQVLVGAVKEFVMGDQDAGWGSEGVSRGGSGAVGA